MDDDERRDDLTPDEAEEARDEGTSGEVAHREGEFDYLRDAMREVLDELRGIRADFAERQRVAASVAVDNGARVTDAPDEGASVEVADEEDGIGDPRDRDYSIER